MYVIKQHKLQLEQAEAESILPIAKRHILATEQMKMTNPSYILNYFLELKCATH